MAGSMLGPCMRRASTSASTTVRFAHSRIRPATQEQCRALRQFTSAARQFEEQEIQPTLESQMDFAAAPEIDFDPVHAHSIPLLKRIRIVPDSPAYFSARPVFTDDYIEVQTLYYKYKVLPRLERRPLINFLGYAEMKAGTGAEPITESRHRKMVVMLKDLAAIEPVLMPPEVEKVLNKHKRARQPGLVKAKVFDLDEWGRSLGVGRRKESTAKAFLVMGEGEVQINGKPLTEMFGRIHDRESALWPLKITNRIDKYNVWAMVKGGGPTGQAEAMTLAVAKALIVHEPELEERLLATGCLFRDPRTVERKKTGHLKARKMPAWVKR